MGVHHRLIIERRCGMNKIKSKEFAEAMRLRNVLRFLNEHRNDLVGKHKAAKKAKDLKNIK